MNVRRGVIVTILVLTAALVSSQSLLDDPQYRTLVTTVTELKQQAQTALDEGRYDDSIALSRQAERVASEAEEYAEQRVLAFRANSWVNRAQQRMRFAESINAPTHYPEEWELAARHMADARSAFEARDWISAIAASRLVVSALEDVQPVRVVAEPERRPEPPPRPEPEPEPEPVLPRYYVVRLIPERRDCFWRIAEYDFVYGDPWKWPELYEANRHKIPDPDNPDLILPGMIVEIPSLAGERREGYWNPEDLP